MYKRFFWILLQFGECLRPIRESRRDASDVQFLAVLNNEHDIAKQHGNLEGVVLPGDIPVYAGSGYILNPDFDKHLKQRLRLWIGFANILMSSEKWEVLERSSHHFHDDDDPYSTERWLEAVATLKAEGSPITEVVDALTGVVESDLERFKRNFLSHSSMYKLIPMEYTEFGLSWLRKLLDLVNLHLPEADMKELKTTVSLWTLAANVVNSRMKLIKQRRIQSVGFTDIRSRERVSVVAPQLRNVLNVNQSATVSSRTRPDGLPSKASFPWKGVAKIIIDITPRRDFRAGERYDVTLSVRSITSIDELTQFRLDGFKKGIESRLEMRRIPLYLAAMQMEDQAVHFVDSHTLTTSAVQDWYAKQEGTNAQRVQLLYPDAAISPTIEERRAGPLPPEFLQEATIEGRLYLRLQCQSSGNALTLGSLLGEDLIINFRTLGLPRGHPLHTLVLTLWASRAAAEHTQIVRRYSDQMLLVEPHFTKEGRRKAVAAKSFKRYLVELQRVSQVIQESLDAHKLNLLRSPGWFRYDLFNEWVAQASRHPEFPATVAFNVHHINKTETRLEPDKNNSTALPTGFVRLPFSFKITAYEDNDQNPTDTPAQLRLAKWSKTLPVILNDPKLIETSEFAVWNGTMFLWPWPEAVAELSLRDFRFSSKLWVESIHAVVELLVNTNFNEHVLNISSLKSLDLDDFASNRTFRLNWARKVLPRKARYSSIPLHRGRYTIPPMAATVHNVHSRLVARLAQPWAPLSSSPGFLSAPAFSKPWIEPVLSLPTTFDLPGGPEGDTVSPAVCSIDPLASAYDDKSRTTTQLTIPDYFNVSSPGHAIWPICLGWYPLGTKYRVTHVAQGKESPKIYPMQKRLSLAEHTRDFSPWDFREILLNGIPRIKHERQPLKNASTVSFLEKASTLDRPLGFSSEINYRPPFDVGETLSPPSDFAGPEEITPKLLPRYKFQKDVEPDDIWRDDSARAVHYSHRSESVRLYMKNYNVQIQFIITEFECVRIRWRISKTLQLRISSMEAS